MATDGFNLAHKDSGAAMTFIEGRNWFATWAEARTKQLELAREEIGVDIVPCPADEPVDYGNAPEPQEMTPEWVARMGREA